ncbi:MAG: DciA family protein [Deltaproteobacteria bacterium]
MGRGPGPQRLALALSELIAQRGYARVRGDAQLQSAWAEAAGAAIARQTRAVAIRRGVLHVAVDHAPLLSELAGFYRQALLEKLQEKHAGLRIRDVKFKLDSGIAARNRPRPVTGGPDG